MKSRAPLVWARVALRVCKEEMNPVKKLHPPSCPTGTSYRNNLLIFALEVGGFFDKN